MNIIVAQPQDWSVVASPDSGRVKMELLAKLQAVRSVATPQEQEEAVRCCQEVKRVLSEVESLRKTIKKPIIDLGKRVDFLASDFSGVLSSDIERITELISIYQRAEMQRVQEEEQVRQAEITRSHAAEESARQNLLVAQSIVVPQDENAAALAEGLRVAAEIEVEERGLAADLAIRAPEAVAAKTSGLAMREVVLYRIDDPAKVYKTHPEFFELTEKKRVISSSISKDFVCDGMTVWSDLQPIIRK